MDTATSNTGGGSAFASDSSTNLATVIKGLKKFDGKDPAEFKTWMKKFCVVLGVTRKDILPLLKKQRKPDPADTAAFDSYTRANEDLYAILFLLVELPAALSIQKHEDDTGISGDGQAAFEELCNNYDRVTDEVIRAKMEELENNPMNPGENPDDYFNQKHLLRTQLDKMGEPISDRRFKDICVQGFSDEYKDVKLMVFRDPTFNVLDMQSTMRNIFLDEQSRKGRKGRIAGRGFAMATTASDIICHGCYEPGHIRRNCPKIKNRAKKKTKPAGATKWCSKHNTTSHSDEECYQQGGKRPGDTKDSSKAFTACSNCTHCSSASNKHDSNNEVAVVDFTRDEDAFDSGFMFATCSRISGRNFAASSTGVGLLVDTGASETMFDNRLIPDGNLHDYTQRNSPKIVDVAGESQLKGTATGILHCTVKDNRGQRLRVRIQGLIVPGLGRNIFSPTSLLKKGLRCVVEESTPHLTIQGKVIPLTQDPRDQGMCTLDITFEQNVQPSGTKSLVPHQKQSQTHTANAVCFTLVSADTWHRRFGHLNARSLDILRKDTGTGVDYRDSLSPCGVCQIAKHKQSPHPKQSTRELSRPGQLVVIDNMGPVNPPAKYKGGSFPYACKITDDYTKMKEVYLLRKKSDTTEAVHTYNMCVAAAGGYRIETIRCDKGGENTGSEFRDYCKNSAIKLEYAATNTPQQIGVSERDGQTLAGVTRCLLKDGDFPPSMWGELMLTAAYLLNRSPHSALGGATPYSKLHNKSPDLSGLRVIGARAFVHHERYRKKLDDRAFEGKLCGFGLDSQTYRILNPSNGAVVESRNVTFIESPPRSVPFQYSTEANGYESDVLSFTSLLDSPHSTSDLDFMAQNELLRQEVRKMQQDNLAREEIHLELDGHEDEHGNGQDLGDGDALSPHLPSTPAGPSSETHASSPSPSSSIPPEPDTSASPGSSGMRRLQVTRASTRGKPTSDDHIDVNLVPANLEVTMNDRGRAHATTGRVEPSGLSFTQLAEIADQAQLPCPGDTEDFAHVAEDPFTVPRAHAYVTTTHEHHGILEETNQAIKIPNTYDEAMSSPQREEWKGACSKEMDNLRKHNVYNLVPLSSVPKGEKILGTKFVFKKKLDGRFKARLVVGGHRQEPGQDYGRSYAPVCRIGSIRITCAIGCHNNWPIYQLDVVGAFLNALCDRDVYVRPAPGTSAKNSATGEPMVYKLERSLYGLSQSPALWNDTLNESLTVFGWKRTQSDPCVYVYTSGNIIVILTVYVDDILITGGDQQLVDQKKKELTDRFEMTDMGEVKRILGIDVQRDYEQGTLAISQEHYVNTLLERFGMQEANPVSTPGYGAEISTNQPQDQILGPTDKKIYQSMTGSILYLAQCTRFDLSYAALQLSKACSNPAQVNMTAAKHVLRYLRGNPVLPIVYKRGQFRLAAFTDSSFGANPDNGRSTTGYLFFLAGGLISYGAKTQTLTAQSTVEAEIQALSYSAREAVYISNFMTELNFKTFGSVPINSDSTGALTVAGNAMHSQRTKHVALRYFFVRELVLRGQITLHHRPSEHQLADIATKYLPKHRFASIIQQIKDFSC